MGVRNKKLGVDQEPPSFSLSCFVCRRGGRTCASVRKRGSIGQTWQTVGHTTLPCKLTCNIPLFKNLLTLFLFTFTYSHFTCSLMQVNGPCHPPAFFTFCYSARQPATSLDERIRHSKEYIYDT